MSQFLGGIFQPYVGHWKRTPQTLQPHSKIFTVSEIL